MVPISQPTGTTWRSHIPRASVTERKLDQNDTGPDSDTRSNGPSNKKVSRLPPSTQRAIGRTEQVREWPCALDNEAAEPQFILARGSRSRFLPARSRPQSLGLSGGRCGPLSGVTYRPWSQGLSQRRLRGPDGAGHGTTPADSAAAAGAPVADRPTWARIMLGTSASRAQAAEGEVRLRTRE